MIKSRFCVYTAERSYEALYLAVMVGRMGKN